MVAPEGARGAGRALSPPRYLYPRALARNARAGLARMGAEGAWRRGRPPLTPRDISICARLLAARARQLGKEEGGGGDAMLWSAPTGARGVGAGTFTPLPGGVRYRLHLDMTLIWA